MHIESIILFHKIAAEKSISKVAEQNHISQPALSQQMQRLEESLGTKLLERSNRGIELTESGKIMEKYALQFIKTHENLIEDLNNLLVSSSTIRIGSTPVAGTYAIPCSLYKATKKFSHLTFNLSTMSSASVVREILQDKLDFGFVVGNDFDKSLVLKPLFSDRVYLVANKNFHCKEKITHKELEGLPLIMLIETFSSRRLLEEYLKNLNVDMRKIHVLYNLDSTESVKSSVLQGHGVAFLPYMSLKKELYLNQLKIIEIEHFHLSYDIHIAHKPKSAVAPEVSKVISYFEQQVSKTIC